VLHDLIKTKICFSRHRATVAAHAAVNVLEVADPSSSATNQFQVAPFSFFANLTGREQIVFVCALACMCIWRWKDFSRVR